jgi:hypothetical protein
MEGESPDRLGSVGGFVGRMRRSSVLKPCSFLKIRCNPGLSKADSGRNWVVRDCKWLGEFAEGYCSPKQQALPVGSGFVSG